LKPEEQVAALPMGAHVSLELENLNKAIHTDWAWVKAHTRLETRAVNGNGASGRKLAITGKDLREAEEWLAQVGPKKTLNPPDLQRQYVLTSRKAESRRQRATLGASLGLF